MNNGRSTCFKQFPLAGPPAESLPWSASRKQSLAADVASLQQRLNKDAARVARSTNILQNAAEGNQITDQSSSNSIGKTGHNEDRKGGRLSMSQRDSACMQTNGLTDGLTSPDTGLQNHAKQLLGKLIADQKELQLLKASITCNQGRPSASSHAAEVVPGFHATLDELLQQAKDAEQSRAAQREAAFKAQLAQLQGAKTSLEQKLNLTKQERSHFVKNKSQSQSQVVQLQQQLAQRNSEVARFQQMAQVELSDYPLIQQINTLQQQLADLKRQRQPSCTDVAEAIAAKKRLQKCLEAERKSHLDATHDFTQVLDGMQYQLDQASCCQNQLAREKHQQADYITHLQQQLAKSEEAVQQLGRQGFSQEGTCNLVPAPSAAHVRKDIYTSQVSITT